MPRKVDVKQLAKFKESWQALFTFLTKENANFNCKSVQNNPGKGLNLPPKRQLRNPNRTSFSLERRPFFSTRNPISLDLFLNFQTFSGSIKIFLFFSVCGLT